MSRQSFRNFVENGGFANEEQKAAFLAAMPETSGHTSLARLYAEKSRLGWWTLDQGAEMFGDQVGGETAEFFFRTNTIETLDDAAVNMLWWCVMNATRPGDLFEGSICRLRIADRAFEAAFAAKFSELTIASRQPGGHA